MFKIFLVLLFWFLEWCVIKGGKIFRAFLELFLVVLSIKWVFLFLKFWINFKVFSVSLMFFKSFMIK